MGAAREMAAATEMTTTRKTASAAVRTCPDWLSKTNESCAYQAKQFNLFHTGKFVADSLRCHCASVGFCGDT
jgi:hypothetical protein